MKVRKCALMLALLFCICCSCQKKNDKVWLHRSNSIEKAQYFKDKYAGMEIDITYVDSLQTLLVCHGKGFYDQNPVNLECWLDAFERQKKMKLWLDLKNLNNDNKTSVLAELNRICDKYKIKKKNIIIESSNADCLSIFKTADYQVSFYIERFKPEECSANIIQKHTDKIREVTSNNNITTISGYYYQYHFMRDSFPDKDILIWYHFLDTIVKNEYIQLANNDPKVKVLLVADEMPRLAEN